MAHLYHFHVDDLLAFLFPVELQHPLAASRLFIFALYGPLDEHGHLRSGKKGGHILAEYELETMSMQIEREDILQIYLHRSRDMGLLSTAEQDMIINQADAHLKREKGKAMLPRITKDDVCELLKVNNIIHCILISPKNINHLNSNVFLHRTYQEMN
jgi:hypothetical protein